MENLYIVVELQKEDGNLTHILTDYTNESSAHYGFHYAAAFAAVSEVDKHTIILLDTYGRIIQRAFYPHQPEILDEDGIVIASKQYVVIEYQINDDQIGKLSTNHATLQSAQNEFYTIAAAAAISSVKQHIIFMIDENGKIVDYKKFLHE